MMGWDHLLALSFSLFPFFLSSSFSFSLSLSVVLWKYGNNGSPYLGPCTLCRIASKSSAIFNCCSLWFSGDLQLWWFEFRHRRIVGGIWTSLFPTWRVLLPRPCRTVLRWPSRHRFHWYVHHLISTLLKLIISISISFIYLFIFFFG